MADNIIENIEDIDTTLNPVTKDHGLEMLGNVSDQPVALRRFSRAIFKIGGLIKGLATGKEDKFSKNSAFNKNKSDAVNSNDSNTLATSKAVKTAYDRGSSGVTKADTAQNAANAAQTKANQAYTLADGKEPKFSKNSGFNLNISHLVNSTSKTLVASALAVKTAYDKAIEAIGLTNTNKSAIQNNTEQIENLSSSQSTKDSIFFTTTHALVKGFLPIDSRVKNIVISENGSFGANQVTKTFTVDQLANRQLIVETYFKITDNFLHFDGNTGDTSDNSALITLNYKI